MITWEFGNHKVAYPVGDDSQMTWIIVNIWVKYVYLLSLSCLKKYYVFFKQ